VPTFRSPVTKPLLRKGTPKPVPPDPRAYDTFRVTQQFGDLDAYYKDRPHSATDIGNFTCGDPVVAMAAGIAYPLKDKATVLGAPSDALGVRVDHGNGIATEYWHLNRIDITSGQRVAQGEQIGIVGDTGLGTVCHVHVEAKRNGVRIDPEPLMFGGSLGEENDVASPFGTGTIGAKINLRAAPSTTAAVNFQTTTPIDVELLEYEANGGAYTVDGQTRKDWFRVRRNDEHWVAGAFVGNRSSPLFPASDAACREDLRIAEAKVLAAEQTVADLKTRISAAKVALG
jgi:hypothetical protein